MNKIKYQEHFLNADYYKIIKRKSDSKTVAI